MAVPVVRARPRGAAWELHHDTWRNAHGIAARLGNQAPLSPDDDRAAKRLRPTAPQIRIFLRDAAEHRIRRNERGSDVAIKSNRPPRSEQLDAVAEGHGCRESDLIHVGEPLAPIEV